MSSNKTTIKTSLIISLLLICTIAFGQEKKENVSNAELFSSQAGTLIEKEFIDLGNIGKTEIQILKITDMISGKSVRSLRITQKVKGSYSSDTKIAHLDSDEIDGLIKSMNVIKKSVFGTSAKNYTEITFRSRGGFETGCFWSKNDWSTYLQIEKYDRKSMVWLNRDDFDEFLDLMELAKTKI